MLPMSLISSLQSITNGIFVPPLGPVRLMVAKKDWFCSGTISGALSVTLAPERYIMQVTLFYQFAWVC